MRLQCNQLGKAFGVALLLAATVAITSTRAAFINLTPTNGANSDTSVKLSDLIAGTNDIDGITVGDRELVPDNLDSISRVAKFVGRKLEQNVDAGVQ